MGSPKSNTGPSSRVNALVDHIGRIFSVVSLKSYRELCGMPHLRALLVHSPFSFLLSSTFLSVSRAPLLPSFKLIYVISLVLVIRFLKRSLSAILRLQLIHLLTSPSRFALWSGT